jgi:outer membrane immunogenic protein
MGTARGRIGYLVAPSVLLYATGGLAYGGTYLKTFPSSLKVGQINNYLVAQPVGISTQNAQQNLNVGWTAGGGAEWMMAPNWSIKGEAIYYDLGNTSVSNVVFYPQDYAAASNPSGGSTTRAYYQGIIARAGVNYHFNFVSAPVVAKF